MRRRLNTTLSDNYDEFFEPEDQFGDDGKLREKKIAKLREKVEPTLLSNIERINEVCRFCQMKDELYDIGRDFISFVAQKLHINQREAVIFSLIIETSCNRSAELSDIAQKVNCSPLRVMSYLAEANALKRRRMIKTSTTFNDNIQYRVRSEVVSLVGENKEITEDAVKGLSDDQFFAALDELLDEYDDSRKEQELLSNMEDLISDNMQLNFCARISDMLDLLHHNEEKVVLMVMCSRLVNDDDDNIGVHNWEGYVSRAGAMATKRALARECTLLQKNNLIEPAAGDGMRDNYYYRLTRGTKELLFKGIDIMSETKDMRRAEVMDYDGITKKKMFYNVSDQKDIDRLSKLLMPKNFREVQKRLKEEGQRTGFCCLFYGSPGTGKTETVYQLARATHRNIFVIDVAKIKSCFVGESEKNLTNAFRAYARLVGQSENAPIHLFNEADAVLGIRQEGATRAVDKMENSLQNIILQEMEKLNGIMIATTNLTQNFDKAFERRFIFKIEFHKPDLEAKKGLWKSLVPSLSKKEVETLANRFDLSGGQIENVARKRSVEYILEGVKPDLGTLCEYCQAEQINSNRRRIGF